MVAPTQRAAILRLPGLYACTAGHCIACRQHQVHSYGADFLALLENIFSVLDMRSFSSVWFWIVLALFWSSVNQVILGVPYELVFRAKKGEDARDVVDMHTLIDVHIRRRLRVVRRAGHWIFGFSAAFLTMLFVLAFSYRIEFAQAVFTIMLPFTIVQLLTLRLAFRIERQNLREGPLCRAILTHRLYVQLLGVVSIFVTAVWGMWYVMARSALGF